MLWLFPVFMTVQAVDLCGPLLKSASFEEALVKLETTEIQDPSE